MQTVTPPPTAILKETPKSSIYWCSLVLLPHYAPIDLHTTLSQNPMLRRFTSASQGQLGSTIYLGRQTGPLHDPPKQKPTHSRCCCYTTSTLYRPTRCKTHYILLVFSAADHNQKREPLLPPGPPMSYLTMHSPHVNAGQSAFIACHLIP